MIEWLLIVYLNGTTDFDVWGGYKKLDACQRSLAFLEQRYQYKKEPLRAECVPVTATQFYQKP